LLAGIQGTSRRLIQDFCHSVLSIPISLGAIQKVIDRSSQALLPHYEAIATLARQAPVGYIDETPWYCQNALNWLWTMTTETVSLFLIHPNRSKAAFFERIDDWSGLLVSDGYGVYQDWVNRRQTCLAHLIRTARGLSSKRDATLAACGRWALRELQRLCHMAKAPPRGGEWRAWYARFCSLIDRYHERKDEAGRLARRLQQREMTSLWVFLSEAGWTPRITGRSGRSALRCCGANAPTGPTVPKAIAGWSGVCHFVTRAVSSANRPTRFWWRRSAVCSTAVSPISPGSTPYVIGYGTVTIPTL
jgi:transposase